MERSTILGYARTPFGRLGGALSSVDGVELGGAAIASALERAGVEPEHVGHVSFGQVIQAGQGQIPSRQAQIKAGIPKDVASETINKVCASSMRAVGISDMSIRAGESDVVVAGGMESMSRAPYMLPGARFGYRMGDAPAVDAMTHDGLTNPFTGSQMIFEASEGSNRHGIARSEMDRFAARSHRLAAEAADAGRLSEEIVPVAIVKQGAESEVVADESIRPDTTIEALSKLKVIGGEGATHTAGNSPGISDGAAALVLASESWARDNEAEPLASIVSYGMVGDDYAALTVTPGRAAEAALKRAGRSPDEVDVWEINEAFASVALNTISMLSIDEDRVNRNGGAVALGHPIGASGARILGALVNELRRRGGGLGCAAICSGGGQGDAIVIEA